MRKALHTIVAPTLVAGALILVGCGDDDSGDNGSANTDGGPAATDATADDSPAVGSDPGTAETVEAHLRDTALEHTLDASQALSEYPDEQSFIRYIDRIEIDTGARDAQTVRIALDTDAFPPSGESLQSSPMVRQATRYLRAHLCPEGWADYIEVTDLDGSQLIMERQTGAGPGC